MAGSRQCSHIARTSSYGERAIVANVRTEASHEATAWQRFTRDGPLAFLPLSNGECSIVWSVKDATADALLAKDDDAFRAALKAADFQSVRGKFKFNTNQHPIQDIYVREVVKEGDVLTNKIIGTAFTDHADAYAKDCPLK